MGGIQFKQNTAEAMSDGDSVEKRDKYVDRSISFGFAVVLDILFKSLSIVNWN